MPSWSRRGCALALAVLVCLAVAGCGKRAPSWGAGTASRSGLRDGEPFHYALETLTRDGGLIVVLVADGCRGGSLASGPTARGQLRAVDGRQVDWVCTTRDGAKGTVIIDGQAFDLSRGAIFLVSLQEHKTAVEQIPADMAKFQGDRLEEQLHDLGAKEPSLADFLKACGAEP